MKKLYDIQQVINLHDKIIEETGGVKGIINMGLLEGALSKPFIGLADGTELYPGIIKKAAILFEALVCYHPFTDGNKRTAEIITYIYLWNSGFIWNFNEDEVVDFALDVAENKLSIKDIEIWIKERLEGKE